MSQESTSDRRNERRSEGGSNASNVPSGSGGLPSPDGVKVPKTVEEAEQMLQLGERMISCGLKGAGSLSHPEREALKAVFTTIFIKMKVLAKTVLPTLQCEFHIS